MSVFREKGKPEYLGKNLLEQRIKCWVFCESWKPEYTGKNLLEPSRNTLNPHVAWTLKQREALAAPSLQTDWQLPFGFGQSTLFWLAK